jgi:hypothetical protein
MKKALFLPILITTLVCASHEAKAVSTLVSGGATIDYDAAAWATLAGGLNVDPFKALVLNEFFDQAGVTSHTGTQILFDEVVANPSTTGLYHGLNGSTVGNLAGRTNQATSFAYDALNLTSHTGVIGLGGITRWDVNPLLGGGVLGFGDFTLAYHASRVIDGRSGWALTVHLPGGATAFDLTNVTTNATDYSLSISGDLVVSPEFASLLLTPSNYLKDVGNFSFSASAVPEPSRALTMLAGVAALGFRRRRTSRMTHA